MREIVSGGIFRHKSASQERDQSWREIATNRNYQDFSLILGAFWDTFNNHEEIQGLSSERKIQEIELAGEDKSVKVSMIIHAHF